MKATLAPLQHLTNPSAKWVKVLMFGCLLWTVTLSVISLKDDLRRSSRVRVRKGRNEWVLEPETEPRLTPSELDRKADSLKNSPGYNKARVEMDYFDLIYN